RAAAYNAVALRGACPPRDRQRPRRAQDDTAYCSSRPRVSGITLQVNAERRYAAPVTAKAMLNPRVVASAPTVNGAAALAIRPMLYVNPCAVARTAVG